jgi:hypothetical protein
MDRTKKLQDNIRLASASGAVAAGQYAALRFNELQASNFLPPWLPLIIALILTAVLQQLLEHLLSSILESSRLIRKLFLQRQYIEGLWVDVGRTGNQIVAIGYSTISFSDGQYKFSGEDFDIDSGVRGYYRIDLIAYEWPVLKYTFVYTTSTEESNGYGEAQFSDTESTPPKCNGFCHIFKTGSRFTFESFRVIDRKLIYEAKHGRLQMAQINKYLQDFHDINIEILPEC